MLYIMIRYFLAKKTKISYFNSVKYCFYGSGLVLILMGDNIFLINNLKNNVKGIKF